MSCPTTALRLSRLLLLLPLLLGSCVALAVESSPSPSTAMATAATAADPPAAITVIVSGATGNVGSRLVRRLIRAGEEDGKKYGGGGVRVRVVALVRNAEKARSMFASQLLPPPPSSSSSSSPRSSSFLTILEADYADLDRLRSALDDVSNDEESTSSSSRRLLFLACGNVPDQAELEMNVVRAANRKGGGGVDFCVKLSTATPAMDLSYGRAHRIVEEKLKGEEESDDCAVEHHCVLRPNIFMQMLSSDTFVGVDLKDSDVARHPLADDDISTIDCEDVAACAAAILTSKDPAREHGGRVYELTGPEAVRLSDRLAREVSRFRPRDVRVEGAELERILEASGMPAAAAGGMRPFMDALAAYSEVTTTVETLLGRPARSLGDFVMDNPAPFLPRTFKRLVGRARAPSFREAAYATETSLEEYAGALGDDEVLVRVQAAGVNGGADTFACTRAPPDSRDFPLGNEGAGVVVLCGEDVSRFTAGDTAVFVASGAYGEYAIAKEARCARLPPGTRASPCELTALRISALTALVSLEATAPIEGGDVVLVSACCGGTGHFAVQIAKRMGATVIGTVGSTAKVATAEGLGADRVIDLSRESLGDVLKEEFPRGVDVAYEGVGGPLLRDVYDNLSEGGRILLVGSISQYPHNKEGEVLKANIEGLDEDIMDVFRAGKTVEFSRGRKIIGNVWGGVIGSDKMPYYRDRVYTLLSKGELRPIVEPMPAGSNLEGVCDAVDHMLSRKSIGKVCAVISE